MFAYAVNMTYTLSTEKKLTYLLLTDLETVKDFLIARRDDFFIYFLFRTYIFNVPSL